MKTTYLAAILSCAAACSAAPTSLDDATALSGGKADNAGAATAPIPLLAAKRYFTIHDVGYSREHIADMGKGLFPVVGNVFEPGGKGKMIAEAGKPFVIRYDRYLDTYSTATPPAPSATVRVAYCSDCGEQTVYDTYKQVTLNYRIDRGPVQTVDVPTAPNLGYDSAQDPLATIDIPAGANDEIEYWFRLTRPDDSVEWDSSYGANYHVQILSPPTATLFFEQSSARPVQGTIKAGETVRIAYDRERLLHAVWGDSPIFPKTILIQVFVSFDGGAPQVLPIDQDYGSLLQPIVRVPAAARSMELWFKGEGDVYVGSQREHHVAYDSNYGKNFTYAVQ